MTTINKLNADQASVLDAMLGVMPALTGTDKQVAWATEIRREMAAFACLTTFGSAIALRDPRTYAEQMAAAIKGNANLQVVDAARWINAQQALVKAGAAQRLDMMSVINGKTKI